MAENSTPIWLNLRDAAVRHRWTAEMSRSAQADTTDRREDQRRSLGNSRGTTEIRPAAAAEHMHSLAKLPSSCSATSVRLDGGRLGRADAADHGRPVRIVPDGAADSLNHRDGSQAAVGEEIGIQPGRHRRLTRTGKNPYNQTTEPANVTHNHLHSPSNARAGLEAVHNAPGRRGLVRPSRARHRDSRRGADRWRHRGGGSAAVRCSGRAQIGLELVIVAGHRWMVRRRRAGRGTHGQRASAMDTPSLYFS